MSLSREPTDGLRRSSSLDSPGGLTRYARYATRKKKGKKNETEQSEGRERVLYPLPSSFSRRHSLGFKKACR